jgi:UDPglucose 6-dehydrogenase
MNIGIVGLGKLGICLAVTFSKHFRVFGIDVSEQRIQRILNQERFVEPQVNEYLARYRHNLTVSRDYDILRGCDLVFIITQTPSLPSGKFDLSFVETALRKIHEENPECLAVVSSTINIGDMGKLRRIHERIAYNPEFIGQGSIIKDFENPKFVLIGSYTATEGEMVVGIWRKIHNRPAHIVRPVEAEIIKLSLNASFTLGITFANIIGEICEKSHADSDVVLDMVYQDRRNYKPGLGFGGPCFPRDVNCFRVLCKENSIDSGYRLASLLSNLNDYTIEKYYKALISLGKRRIGILGLAYKPGVPYIDESQSLKIAQKLVSEGFEVFVYDSLAEENAKSELKGDVRFCSSADECLEKAEVVFVGTLNYRGIKTSKPVVNPFGKGDSM